MPGTYTDREIAALGIEDWKPYTKILEAAGLNAVDRPISITSVCKLHKIYVNKDDPQKVKDILFANDPITKDEFEDAIDFFAQHPCAERGVFVDSNGKPIDLTTNPTKAQIVAQNPNIQDLLDVQDTYIKAVNDLVTEDDLGGTEYDPDAIWAKEEQLDNYMAIYLNADQCYTHLRGTENEPFKGALAVDQQTREDWEIKNSLAYLNYNHMVYEDHTGERNYAVALAATYVGAMMYPIIKGKSFEELKRMYPAGSGKDSFFANMAEQAKNLSSAFPQDITEEEVKNFQRTGILPERLNSRAAKTQEVFDDLPASVSFAANLSWQKYFHRDPPKIAEYNIPDLPLIDHRGVPDFEAAAMRIADDAKKFMDSRIGGDLGADKDKIIDNYGRIVETQVKRYLLESGYVKNCRQGDIDKLNAEMTDFIEGKTNKLPENFTKDIVDKALGAGLDGVTNFFPQKENVLDTFTTGELGFVDKNGKKTFTSLEASGCSMIMNTETHNSVADIMQHAGVKRDTRATPSIVKIHKIYEHPELAKDILLGKKPINNADIKAAALFYQEYPCVRVNGASVYLLQEDGKWVNKANAAKIMEVSDAYLSAYASLEVEDVVDITDFQTIRQSADALNSLSQININEAQTLDYMRKEINGRVEFPYNEQDYARSEALFNLSVFLERTITPEETRKGPDYSLALANSIMYQSIAPLLKGKSVDDLAKMYPIKNGRDSYIVSLYSTCPIAKAILPQDITEQELLDYQNTGKLPDRVNKAQLQQTLDEIYESIDMQYERANGQKIQPYNIPAHILIDHDGVPAFEDAAKKIAADAKKLMEEQLGGELGDDKDKIIEEYGNILENQVKKRILESNYVKDCKAGDINTLNANMQDFVDGKTDRLPDNISRDLINDALATSLDGVRAFHPEKVPALDTFNSAKLSYVDEKGKQSFTTRELDASSLLLNDGSREEIANAMQQAGLNVTSRPVTVTDMVAVHKMYAHPELARDVLLARAPVSDADVKAALAFYQNNACTREEGVSATAKNYYVLQPDGKTWVNKANADVMVAASDNFLRAYASLEVEDFVNLDDYQTIRQNADILNNLSMLNIDEGQSYPHFRDANNKQDYPIDKKDYARSEAIFHLATILDKSINPYVKGPTSANYTSCLANSIVYNTVAPLLKGRSIDDITKMYPVVNGRDTLIGMLYLNSESLPMAMPEKITEQELLDYQKTGKLPDSVDKAQLQQILDQVVNYKTEAKVEEYNRPIPIIVDHDGVPNIEGAAKRIGQDAQALMQSKLSPDVSPEDRQKLAADYGRLVENQVMRLLYEDGYVKKCRDNGNYNQLETEVNSFISGNSTLPDFISKGIINRAEMLAMDGLKHFHRDQFKALNALELNSLESEYNLKPGTSLNLPQPADLPQIVTNSVYEAGLAAEIKNYDLKSILPKEQITNAFDELINSNPALSSNARSAAVMENVGGVTGMFYIDGKNIDDYMREKVANYDDLPTDIKQVAAKSAIMQALVTDSNNVDVKTYVQAADGRCQARVSNLVYPANERSANGFFRRRRTATRTSEILAADTVAQKITDNRAEYANKAARLQQRSAVIQRLNAEKDYAANREAELNLGKNDFDPATAALNADVVDKVEFSVMYTLRSQLAAGNATSKDVLMNTMTKGFIDYDSVSEFFDTHMSHGVLELEGNNPSQRAKDILGIHEDFMRTAISSDIDSIVNLTNINDVNGKGYEIAKMAQTTAMMDEYFDNYRDFIFQNNSPVNKAVAEEYKALNDTYSYYKRTVGMLNDMSLIGGTDKAGLDRAMAATLMYNAIGPAIKGKTPQQMQEMYPIANYRSYLDYLSIHLNNFVYDYTRDNELTVDDVVEFQRTGKLPATMNDAKFQQMYNEALDKAKNDYVRAGGTLPAINQAVPQFIEKNNVPDLQQATKKVAVDAMASIAAQYQEINGTQINEQYQREYGRLVEEQLRTLLIQDGYAQKSKDAMSAELLQSNMQEFLSKGGILPYNITKELVNQATSKALENLNTLYPENKDKLTRFNSELNYVSQPDPPESSTKAVGLGVYRAPTEGETTFVSNAQHERVVRSIKALDFTVDTAKNMSDAAREFDNFVGFFPGYAESLNNPEVSKSCNGQITNLFYIDGKPVEEYMDTVIPGFKNSTAANKQNLAKAAIMKAVIEGTPPVDALYYSQDGKGNANLSVRNITYKGNQGAKSRSFLGRFIERKRTESRTRRIYNANRVTLGNVVKYVKEKYQAFLDESRARANRLGLTPMPVSVIPETIKETDAEREARETQEAINAVRIAELQEDIEKVKAYELTEELTQMESDRLAKQEAEQAKKDAEREKSELEHQTEVQAQTQTEEKTEEAESLTTDVEEKEGKTKEGETPDAEPKQPVEEEDDVEYINLNNKSLWQIEHLSEEELADDTEEEFINLDDKSLEEVEASSLEELRAPANGQPVPPVEAPQTPTNGQRQSNLHAETPQAPTNGHEQPPVEEAPTTDANQNTNRRQISVSLGNERPTTLSRDPAGSNSKSKNLETPNRQ